MLRVNQAGEYGATRIYAGQLAVLRRNSPASKLIARMDGQERRHLERFNALMAQRRVRPTVLQPVWEVAGFALGAATALMSEDAAMACTDAVETEIDLHYGRQRERGWRRARFRLSIADCGGPCRLPAGHPPIEANLVILKELLFAFARFKGLKGCHSQ
jgi:hypothetical protein